MADLPHRRCTTCEVTWHATSGELCFCCGTPGDPCGPPIIGSQHGPGGSAWTERQWADIRRQVL